jgi:hypothetical protein
MRLFQHFLKHFINPVNLSYAPAYLGKTFPGYDLF